MPKGPPRDVKKMSNYSTPPKNTDDINEALRSHFGGYIEWEGLDDFLARFPLAFQQVVNLYYCESRTIEETAEVMGCSVSMVNRYLRRTRERLMGWVMGRHY